MKHRIEVKIIEELKEKLAGYLFKEQNHSRGIGTDEFYVQSYLNQIWKNMDLNQKQMERIETAYREMIIDGYLDLEAVPSDQFDYKESESRISLTDEGIFHYIYSIE